MPSNKKKVLFTSHTANFQKFNRPFMRMLREQGYEVHYASMGEEQIEDCDKQFVVPFTRSPFTLSNVRAYRQLKEIIDHEQYDLIHTHTPVGSVVTRLAARQARQRGTRVIYTAHGFHFFTGAPLLNWLVYYPIERLMAHYTDVLITINAEDYARANRHFATSVVYVPGVGVDPKRFDITINKNSRQAIRAKLGIKPNDFVIIYVAELSKRKNQSWLLSALKTTLQQDTSMHLLLVGADSLQGKIHKQSVRYGIQSQVHFLGYRKDIPELLQASDLYVSTSKQEGLPVNILEAMMGRMPIVALECRGVAELLSLVGATPARDMQTFRAAVQYYKKHRSLHREKDAIQSALSRYTTPNIMKNMRQLYEYEGEAAR